MKKRILFISILTLLSVGFTYNYLAKESKTKILKKRHAAFLKKHSFQKDLNLNKKERIAQGLPPNAFLEQEYLNEISPITGKTYPENIFKIQEELRDVRLTEKTPGDASNAWVERGPNNVGGRVRAAVFDPNDATNETVFAGGVSGGLWKNTNISNLSAVWTRVNIPDNLGVASITFDPNNSNIMYVGTGESYVGHTTGSSNGDGVWKSMDGGNSWSRIFGGLTGNPVFQSASNLTVNTPSSIASNYVTFPTTNFGPAISSVITADLILADDGTASPTEGCSAFVNAGAMNGKIALIRRGSCNFTVKVKNAQNAGAIAAIVMNNVGGDPVPMGGTDASITIPSVMISKTDGDLLESTLTSGSTINLSLNPAVGSFTAVVLPGKQHINDVTIKDNNGVSEVYVAVSDALYGPSNASTLIGPNSYGLYKSTDNGTTWIEVSLPLTANGNKHCPNDIEIGADGKIWVSTTASKTHGDGGGVIFSSTDGVIFTQAHQIVNGVRTQIAVSSTDGNKIVALAQLSAGGSVKIVKTTDGFTSNTSLSLPNDADSNISATDFTRNQAFYDLLIEIDPSNDNIIYVGGIDLFKSTNGGTSWSQFSHWYGGFGFQEVHSDQHIAAFAPGDSNKMIFGNDGGIYYTSNGGTITAARNNGLNISQFYSVGVAPTTVLTGDNFAGGLQDNGTHLFQNSPAGIAGSVEMYGGDGAYTFFDQDGTDAYFIRNYVYNGGINLYNLTTNTNTTINSEGASNGSFINELDLDSNLNILYSNYSTSSSFIIRRYAGLTSGSIQKANLTNALLTNSPRAFKVSPYTTTSTTLLVGTVLGDLLKIENANSPFTQSWSEISGPEFVGSISDIEYGETENDIFVTFHNYNVVSIWFTNDGGTTWQNKEGDLPDIPVKAILQNPLRTQEVIIGTELGVWRTSNFDDASPNWVQSYNGMSNVKVLDLDLRDDNMVFAATHGRGVFSGQFTAEVASVNDVLANTKQFTIYPTVSDGNFTLFAKNDLGKSNLLIFDINGKKVHQQKIDFSSQEKQAVSLKLNAGVYIVNLVDNHGKKSSSKIVIK